MAEAYIDGAWDSPDLVALIRLAARNATGLDRLRTLLAPLWYPAQYLRALRSRGTRRFYQIRLPAASRQVAEALCSRIHAAGGNCVAMRS